MTETKADLEKRVAELEKERDRLLGQLSTARAVERPAAARAAAPGRPDYGLSEGERQDLETMGVTNSPFDGKRMRADEQGVEVRTRAGKAALAREKAGPPAVTGERDAIHGVDYVYPSVKPGVLADDEPDSRLAVRRADPR